MDLFLLDTNAVSGLQKGNRPLLTRRSATVPIGQLVNMMDLLKRRIDYTIEVQREKRGV